MSDPITCPFCQEKDAEISRLRAHVKIAEAEVNRMRTFQDLVMERLKKLDAEISDKLKRHLQ